MLFHTELIPESLPVPIRLTDRIVTIGSCFADVMGRQLTDHKLSVLNNPFGTVFNPVSIAKLLTMALRGTKPDESLYVERDGIWFHYDFHSSLWAHSQTELCERLTERLTQTADALRQADWLLLTLGTAVVYRHIQTGQVVANCHKTPGSQFEKYLYQIDHLRDDLVKVLKLLRRANPNLRILLTVSPVRHTRDTLPLNQASKSVLRVIAHELTVWNDWVQYFPSYEIMVDDLRDYRFYEADLIHPNALAQNYIFEKFAQSAFDDELRGFVTEWASIRKALAHRPLYGDTPGHRSFLNSLLKRLDTLRDLVDVEAERSVVLDQLVLSVPAQKGESLQTNSAE